MVEGGLTAEMNLMEDGEEGTGVRGLCLGGNKVVIDNMARTAKSKFDV